MANEISIGIVSAKVVRQAVVVKVTRHPARVLSVKMNSLEHVINKGVSVLRSSELKYSTHTFIKIYQKFKLILLNKINLEKKLFFLIPKFHNKYIVNIQYNFLLLLIPFDVSSYNKTYVLHSAYLIILLLYQGFLEVHTNILQS